MKIWHECRVTHVLWVIWHVEFDVDTHYYIRPKVRSKRSNFENQDFLLKTYLSCPLLSQDSKNVIFFFPYDNQKFQINRVSKMVAITSTCFLGHCAAKNKDIGLKFCTHVGGK